MSDGKVSFFTTALASRWESCVCVWWSQKKNEVCFCVCSVTPWTHFSLSMELQKMLGGDLHPEKMMCVYVWERDERGQRDRSGGLPYNDFLKIYRASLTDFSATNKCLVIIAQPHVVPNPYDWPSSVHLNGFSIRGTWTRVVKRRRDHLCSTQGWNNMRECK